MTMMHRPIETATLIEHEIVVTQEDPGIGPVARLAS